MELIITYLLATMFTMAVHMTKVIAFLFIDGAPETLANGIDGF